MGVADLRGGVFMTTRRVPVVVTSRVRTMQLCEPVVLVLFCVLGFVLFLLLLFKVFYTNI